MGKWIFYVGALIGILWVLFSFVFEKFKSPKEKLILTKRGGVAIAGSKFGWGSRAEWPFGSITLYENSLKVSAVTSYKIIKYSEIKSIEIQGSRLLINLKKSSDYISFVSWGENSELVQLFKKKKIKIA